MDDSIWVETMVSSRTGEPAVILRWYDRSGELSPAQARAFALQVLEAAEAAEGDAFLISFLRDKIGTDEAGQAGVLQAFREYREGQAKK